MNGFGTEISLPLLSAARVINYDSEANAVYIQLPSGQQLQYPARMLYNGYADAIRINQRPLPIIGSWGVVCFPDGDDRFPIWLGSYYSNNNMNAITSSSDLKDSQIDYYSHWSGYYSLLDSQGQEYIRFPDGTELRINSTDVEPTTYRHTVSVEPNDIPTQPQQNTPVRIPMTDSFRVPDPPKPFYVDLRHPSGSSLSITPSGLVSIIAGNPAQASITMTPSGIVTIETGSTQSGGVGPTIVLDPVAQTVLISGQKNFAQITMDGSGNIKIISADNITIDASAGGDIFVKTTEHTFESIDNIIDTYNTHTHGGVTTGSGNTAVPTQQLP